MMGPIAKLLLGQAGYELPPESRRHVIAWSSELELHDDDERMTNNLPLIHTSTERMMLIEQAVIRLTARVKALEAALEAMQGGK